MVFQMLKSRTYNVRLTRLVPREIQMSYFLSKSGRLLDGVLSCNVPSSCRLPLPVTAPSAASTLLPVVVPVIPAALGPLANSWRLRDGSNEWDAGAFGKSSRFIRLVVFDISLRV